MEIATERALNRRTLFAGLALGALCPTLVHAKNLAPRTQREDEEEGVQVLLIASLDSIRAAQLARELAFDELLATSRRPDGYSLSYGYVSATDERFALGKNVTQNPGLLDRAHCGIVLVNCGDPPGEALQERLRARGERYVQVQPSAYVGEADFLIEATSEEFGYRVLVPDAWGAQIRRQFRIASKGGQECGLDEFEAAGYTYLDLASHVEDYFAGAIAASVARIWSRRGITGFADTPLCRVQCRLGSCGSLKEVKISSRGELVA